MAVDGPRDERITERLGELLDPERREAMRERLRKARPDNGAAEAARWLEGLLDRRSDPSKGTFVRNSLTNAPLGDEGRRGSPLRARFARAWVFARTLPRTLTRLIGQTVSLPRPRTLILALGAEERAILAAIERADDLPERVLVVTDSLAIGDVWRAGTAVEHIPGPEDRQATLSGVGYEEFRRRRLALILAHRPRLRRLIEVGEVPIDLSEAVLEPPTRRARLLK